MKEGIGVSDKMTITTKRGSGMKDKAKVSGVMTLTVFDKDGNIKEKLVKKNMIMTVGLQHIADQMSDKLQAPMGYLELGDGTTIALDPSNTQNSNPVVREACTVTLAGTTVSYFYQWNAGDFVADITEAGIFNQPSTGGIMLARNTFTAKPVDSGDTMALSWDVSYA